MEPATCDGPEPSELAVGFGPADPSIIVPQIQRLAITSRTLGFETIVNCAGERSPEMEQLVRDGLIQLVISSINDSNMKIIGLVVTALRHLSATYRDEFQALIPTVPFEFLLTKTSSSEVIDFLERSAFNFDSFASALLSFGEVLANAVANWLQASEDTARATLELLATLAQTENPQFDFGCVKPFLDGNFSPEIRALALNVLIQADPENWARYVEMLMSIFFNENDSGTVMEILHDLYVDRPDVFETSLQEIFTRLVQRVDVPSAAIVLADIAPQLDDAKRQTILELLLNQPVLTIERADAIFRICEGQQLRLPDAFVDRLGRELTTGESAEALACIEAILKSYPEYFATEAAQEKLCAALQRPFEFAVVAFRLCVNCCAGHPVAPPLMEMFHAFASEHENEMDGDLHEAVAAFLEAHK